MSTRKEKSSPDGNEAGKPETGAGNDVPRSTKSTPAGRGRRYTELESLWPTRVVALVVSVLIWVFASYLPRLESISEKEVTASLSYAAPPAGMVASPARRSNVTVRVRGTDDAIAPVGNDSISITVPLPATILPGVQTEVQLNASNAVLPDGVEIMSFTPDTVVVLIDEQLRERVLVRPEFRGEPAAGLTRDDLRYELRPDQVTVSGPRSAFVNLTSIATEPIDLSGRAIDFSQQVRLQLTDPSLRASPDFVTIDVKLEAEPEPAPAKTGSGDSADDPAS